jgi:hypothetical protein
MRPLGLSRLEAEVYEREDLPGLNPEAPLFTHSQPFDHGTVSIYIFGFQVIEQPAPFADHFQQSPAGMVILCMGFEMIGEVVDPLAQNRNLHLRRARIRTMLTVGIDYLTLLLFRERQGFLPQSPINQSEKLSHPSAACKRKPP